MIHAWDFYRFLVERQITFFTGVPDSTLQPLTDVLLTELGVGNRHVVAHNEGGAVALAGGYHLATGKVAMIYLQNSGLGNALNPIISLADPEVYGIPSLYCIGWRGKPGQKDEPQHSKQGEITLPLLEMLNIASFVITPTVTRHDLEAVYADCFQQEMKKGKSVAFVIERGALEPSSPLPKPAQVRFTRENAIRKILEVQGASDMIVSTTGKTSRELYELRQERKERHNRDFLTVGSMGHASMLALALAEQQAEHRVWCIDGDGAALMHLGAWATIGSRQPKGLVYLLIDNGMHESVGGMPTVSPHLDYSLIAKGCGYREIFEADGEPQLQQRLEEIRSLAGPIFIHVKVGYGARTDLGRPLTTTKENKEAFMSFLTR